MIAVTVRCYYFPSVTSRARKQELARHLSDLATVRLYPHPHALELEMLGLHEVEARDGGIGDRHIKGEHQGLEQPRRRRHPSLLLLYLLHDQVLQFLRCAHICGAHTHVCVCACACVCV